MPTTGGYYYGVQTRERMQQQKRNEAVMLAKGLIPGSGKWIEVLNRRMRQNKCSNVRGSSLLETMLRKSIREGAIPRPNFQTLFKFPPKS